LKNVENFVSDIEVPTVVTATAKALVAPVTNMDLSFSWKRLGSDSIGDIVILLPNITFLRMLTN